MVVGERTASCNSKACESTSSFVRSRPERQASNWVDRAQATALYRSCQQAFDNILQHAGASRVSVTVWDTSDQKTCIRIEDDGCGFDLRQLPGLALDGHVGVVGMRERAEALAGEFEIKSLPGTGTAVEVRLPAGGAE
jgi:signal transduction histidine kinase